MAVKTELINQGLPGKLGAANFALLIVLAANANEEGVCKLRYPVLAQIMDIAPKSVSRRVQDIFTFELEGRPILHRVSGGFRITPEILEKVQNCTVYTSNKDIKNISNSKGINASTVLNHFGNKYAETYSCQYNFMYQRDQSLVKNKLLQVYGAENTLKIIDEAFRQRSLFENPPKYPYITIGSLVTFIANKVMTDIKQQEKKENFDTVAFNKEMKEKYWDEYFGD